jgi:hypothetical protein
MNGRSRVWHTWKGNLFGDKEAKTEGARAIIDKAGMEAEYRHE